MNYFFNNKNGRYDFYINLKVSDSKDNKSMDDFISYELLKDLKKN